VALEKALIKPEAPRGAPPIAALFNPNQYGLDASNEYSDSSGAAGLDSKLLQYVGSGPRTLSMELFFDTYEQRTDVRRHTDRIYNLLAIEPTTHAPPICKFTWGRFSFRCVVERVSGRFTLFLDNGTPVRASLTVGLKEYVDAGASSRSRPLQSADHTKTTEVQRGDTLSAIAEREYGDPGAWRPIARANLIANPRVLEVGRLLVVPPLPEGSL